MSTVILPISTVFSEIIFPPRFFPPEIHDTIGFATGEVIRWIADDRRDNRPLRHCNGADISVASYMHVVSEDNMLRECQGIDGAEAAE